MESESTKWAKLLGRAAAHLQNGIDGLADAGFRGLKQIGKKPLKKKKDENPTLFTAKKIGQGLLSFVGTMGDEFYNKYQELKSNARK